MKWIRTHKAATVIIAVIIVLLFVIAASFAKAGDSSPVGKAINTAVSTVTRPLDAAADGIKNGFRGIFEYHEIVKENDALKDEIAQIKKKNSELELEKNEYEELKKLREIFSHDSLKDVENTVSADVTAMDSSSWMNIFTINKGKESGIEKGDPVISCGGLAGRIDETGHGWSKVKSIINDSTKVSFRLSRKPELMGIVEGDGDGGLEGYMFDVKADVKKGDVIITSGIGDYPGGLEIGKVSSVDFNTNTQNRDITVEPSSDFRSASIVVVIL